MKILFNSLVLLISLVSFQIQATLIKYDNEADFNTDIASLSSNTVDFDSLAAGTLITDGSAIDGITFNYSIFGMNLFADDLFDTTSPANYLGVDSGDGSFIGGDSFTMSFAAAQTAIGLFIHSADFIFDGDVTLTTNNGLIVELSGNIDTYLTDGEAYFIGLSTNNPLDAFTSVVLSSINESFAFNVDDITIANSTAVPEPGTGLLMLMAVAGFYFKKQIFKTK
ncbi:hypothetical protein Ping_2642 [Psychromonas ingrahamii 37]|uniref:Ice-binding protein C-terminal domain-containing protein n=1 Tax=Psychromonas ingrahamii (strain DSM 17664 / CCUG 51855 / 37) TaxID=357804 RepID=A1SXZ4_PSYIN|nr:PEP-CTERM sorting domain-containing protein [Psychromonas ingrahamii]ABM04359.1 hypothetical protein Ping_2642 [Psychromonas ingrahamii 37]